MGSEPAAAPANIRVDARANHERILTAATLVLHRDGDAATLSSIAKEAGVGIGTLYRHFPNRGRLVEAVYRNRVVALCESVPPILAAAPSAREALRTWVFQFSAMLVANRDVPEALKPALVSGTGFREDTTRLLTGAVQSILDRGLVAGEFRTDIEPVDVLRIATGISYTAAAPSDIEKPLRIMLDGLHR